MQLKVAALLQEEDEASTSGVDDIPLEKKLGITVRVCFFLSLSNSAMSGVQLSSADAVSASGLVKLLPACAYVLHMSCKIGCCDQLGACALQVQNLYKNYIVKDSVFKAVQDATLVFPANKIIALLGPSGSGKTTLLRLIAGLESVTDGQIFFGGEHIAGRHDCP